MWLNSAQWLVTGKHLPTSHVCMHHACAMMPEPFYILHVKQQSQKISNRPNFISNGLLHGRQILYCLSHRGSPMYFITISQSIKVFWRYFNIFHLCVSTCECFGLSRWWLVVKNPSANVKRCRLDPWVRKIPWRRAWQPSPGFLPGESHGQRSLAGYSPWGCKESDTTEAT